MSAAASRIDEKNNPFLAKGRCLSARAVKTAVCAFIGTKQSALTEGAGFSEEGMAELHFYYRLGMKTARPGSAARAKQIGSTTHDMP